MDKPFFLRRATIFPKRPTEYPLLLFVSLMIPATYWFEMWVVLPSLFPNDSATYWVIFVLGHFILHNVVGNFLGILIIDTSIRGRLMPTEKDPGVKFCTICNTYTPPRSFHCPSCDICILKQDHHCMFTSCCVGFYNHRFFFYFVFYMLLATLIFLPFNVYFLWDKISFMQFSFLLTIVFPVILFFVDFGSENMDYEHVYLIISLLGLVCIVLCSIWFYFHAKLILKGVVVHEMRKCINIYNLGKEKNLQMVFGKRWHLTWISPYLKSPLICNGISFPILEHDKLK